jgi:hypothetical protein
VAISVDDCRELARARAVDWRTLAGEFAERMLPQIFRQGDPVLDVVLPPESRQELEELLDALPSAIFTAADSLGWTYQFWQADAKEAVNASGVKIGADELPPVTQLFTEDYMVLFPAAQYAWGRGGRPNAPRQGRPTRLPVTIGRTCASGKMARRPLARTTGGRARQRTSPYSTPAWAAGTSSSSRMFERLVALRMEEERLWSEIAAVRGGAARQSLRPGAGRALHPDRRLQSGAGGLASRRPLFASGACTWPAPG